MYWKNCQTFFPFVIVVVLFCCCSKPFLSTKQDVKLKLNDFRLLFELIKMNFCRLIWITSKLVTNGSESPFSHAHVYVPTPGPSVHREPVWQGELRQPAQRQLKKQLHRQHAENNSINDEKDYAVTEKVILQAKQANTGINKCI